MTGKFNICSVHMRQIHACMIKYQVVSPLENIRKMQPNLRSSFLVQNKYVHKLNLNDLLGQTYVTNYGFGIEENINTLC